MSARAFAPSGGHCQVDDVLELDEDETRYLLRVRRLRADEGFEVIELDRALWRARFESTTGRRCCVRIVERVEEPPDVPPVSLLLGLPDTRALEELLPGIVELGVAGIHVVQARYSQKKSIDPERLARVIRSALRQCGRYRSLAVEGAHTLEAALAFAADARRLQGTARRDHATPQMTATEGVGDRLDALVGLIGVVDAVARQVEPVVSDFDLNTQRIVAVGPEGGWSDDEERLCIERGLTPCCVGPYVLRTPTAALALCTLALRP